MSVIGSAVGIDHGTMRGYRQHRYRKVDMCDACRQAELEDQRKQKPAIVRTMPRMYIRQYPPYLPGHQDPAWGDPILGRDLVVGDVIVHLGEHHKIDRFEPYHGSLSGLLGEGSRTAFSGDWDIAVGPDTTIRILPRGGAA